jgi:hypothetical protein
MAISAGAAANLVGASSTKTTATVAAGDTGRFHGPYRESKGSLNGALTDVSLLLGSAYVADKVFPVVPVTRTKDIYYKFTKGSKP